MAASATGDPTVEELIEKEKAERTGQFAAASYELASFPEGLYELSHLTKLFLQFNKIAALPRELGLFERLTGLFLQQNSLKTLPAEIGKLKSLSRLRLEHNQLVTLPDEIGQLASLTELHLEHNALRELPSTIGGWKKIRELHVTHNQLRSLPTALGEHTALILMPGKFQAKDGNPLDLLPADTVAQGDRAIFEHVNLDYITQRTPPEDRQGQVEPAAVAELEEMTAKAHRLNAQHRELHHSIAQLSSEFGHDMALRDAINDKLAKSGGEKTLREDRAAALAAQRDELDAKIEQNSARLDELLTQRSSIATELAPLEALLHHRYSTARRASAGNLFA